MPLEVIIVGGGIAGFATAIGLAKSGHQVTIFERRRDESEESGSAIQLQPNAMKILKRWGMTEELTRIAHDNENTHVSDGITDEVIVDMEYRNRGGQWIGHRRDIRLLFQRTALRHGAKLIFGRRVMHIEDIPGRPTIVFEDGETASADLVIGADGTRSKVRQSLFPEYKPTVLPACCFQLRIPFSAMLADTDTATFVNRNDAQIFAAPYRSTFSSVILSSQTFDLQLIDHDYKLEHDPHPETWTERIEDIDFLRERWSDHIVRFRKVIEAGGSAYKWRFVLVNNLPSWTSQSGRIVLVGDACHAMPPYSGQGSAMGIEDAAVLSQILEHASPDQDLSQLAKLYEDIRRPRCDVIQTLARSNGRSFESPEPLMQRKRTTVMRKMNEAIQASTRHGVRPDGKAHFATPEFARWMDDWDSESEVRKAMTERGLDRPRAVL